MYYFGELHIFTSAAVGLEHFSIEEGGKVVLPASVLAELSDYASGSPMLFRISHPDTEVMTHCGVVEFSAEEGSVIAPSWVLEQIGVMSGETVFVETVYLPVGSFARFKPLSSNFLEITDQKAVLENRLRNFSCLTIGDVIPIHYNNSTYLLKVVDARPADMICIINCDLEVEFEEPLGYIAPTPKETPMEYTSNVDENNLPPLVKSLSFTGTGYRLDGKNVKEDQQTEVENTSQPRGIPDYDWKFGTLNFFHNFPASSNKPSDDSKISFSPFSGSGRSLK